MPGLDSTAYDRRQMRRMIAANERAHERLDATTIAEWLSERWDIDADALTFFANYACEHAHYPTPPDTWAAGFLVALELADDPNIGRPTLTVA